MTAAATPPPDSRAPALVVGYGSDLRSDDAAGRRAAEAIADLGLVDVEVRSVHQLAPELAAAMAGRRVVVFVDATVADTAVRVRRLHAAVDPSVTTHRFDAAALLTLAAALDGAPDDAWLVSIPAADLRIGTDLSPATAAAVTDAVARIVDLAG